jgi:hypothetical protein
MLCVSPHVGRAREDGEDAVAQVVRRLDEPALGSCGGVLAHQRRGVGHRAVGDPVVVAPPRGRHAREGLQAQKLRRPTRVPLLAVRPARAKGWIVLQVLWRTLGGLSADPGHPDRRAG